MNKLKEYFVNEDVVITPCVGYDDAVEFSYIEGVRYDKRFSEIIKTGNMTAIQEELMQLKDILYQVRERESFSKTEEFEKVFGKNISDRLEGKMAYIVSNIDMIFSNMILKDNKNYITDYEWVFDFPVPIDYVLYRSLLLNIDYSMMDESRKQELLAFLNISNEDKCCYEKMEEGFQQYVSGKNIFQEYKKNSSQKTVRLNDISKNAYPNSVRAICKDIDEKTILSECIQYKDIFEIKQELTPDTKTIKIQFEVQGAVYQIQECYGIHKNGEKIPLDVIHNASFVINDDYYFDSNAPYFEIRNDSYESFYIKVRIYYENSSIIGYYINKVLECETKQQQLLVAQNQIIDDKNIISQLEAEIKRMKSTKVWKIYSKLKRL
jgi:hypothetical protein